MLKSEFSFDSLVLACALLYSSRVLAAVSLGTVIILDAACLQSALGISLQSRAGTGRIRISGTILCIRT